ncbi:putative LPS assembly protein LptD [Tenacibaculum todarodis]|uniref:putative LPS assembly protein LptD n=1 Tax=Tenacibaculum todarodis TaxID=1850252 RepID=UPI000AD2238A|nr:putative LPS assembly protein LptD [Tenacibaculum todarodis]
MRTNLTYILLFFCFFATKTTNAQDLKKPLNINAKAVKKRTLLNSKRDTVPDFKKDSLNLTKKDTIVTDSIKPKGIIEGLITHDAKDYTFQDAKKKTLTLYNEAHVTYTDIDLKAGIIIVDYKNNTVYATGIKDSTGYKQRPVFKQGNQESEQDSILFNFKTKKALVYGVKTVQGDIITYGEKTKRVNDSTIYMRNLRFTTSKKDNPDYYIATNKAKLIPGKKIIVGGSNLVLADVPTPFYLPFAYFPLSDKRTSGFIIPSWGESNSQGFFLQNGGYYFALSDYFDLTVLGDLYTNGSWGLRTDSQYYKRYKFSGNFSVRFENIKQSILGLSDYSEATNFNIRWSHSQDNKANPNARFSASVNLGSSTYYRQSQNEFNNSEFLTNTLSSSISYYRNFVGTPFNMNVTATHSQNTNTESITMTLPSLQVNMDRIYPFAGKGGVQKNPIQKMGFTYSMQGEYRINTTDDEFFTPKMFNEAKSGVKHATGTSTNLKAFKYFTLSPSINYSETWYFDKINKRFDPTSGENGAVVNDTISGFNRFNNYNVGVSLSTNIYGTFNFKKGRLKALRHTFRPSVSWGYRPDFAEKHNLQVQQSIDPTDLVTYSPFEGGIYGTPGSGVSNSIGIQLNNVLEAKMAPKDPDSDEEDEKITILNNLNFSTSYNIAADSLRWSPVSANAGTRLFKDKLALNVNATLDPYQVNDEGQRINKFNNNIFRMSQLGVSANYSLSSKDFEKKDENKNASNPNNQNNKGNGAQDTPDVFGNNLPGSNQFPNDLGNRQNNNENSTKETKLYNAKIPWTLNLVYAMNYANNGLTSGITNNSIMFSGDFELTPKWNIGFSSGYDIDNSDFTYTRLSFSRDLDSWRFNFNWTPFGPNSSYNFFIGVKASALSDLKWEKNKPRDRVLF